jgi:tetratricopeptide (TPR) repeat protein
MKRTLNLRFLLWTLAVLVLTSVAVHYVHAAQMRRNAGALLERAARASEAGDLDQALTYYAHYLLYEPDDVAALAKSALILDQKANSPEDWLRAKNALDRVLRRAPARKDLRFRLALGLIHLRQFREAITQIEALLSTAPLPGISKEKGALDLPPRDNRAELEHILGWCFEASGDYPKAISAFSKAIEHDPSRLETYVLLAEVLQNRQGQTEEAGQVLDEMVGANDQSFRAYLIRYRFRRASADGRSSAGADADLKRAFELAPEEPTVLLAVADEAELRGDSQKARESAHKAWALDPTNTAAVKALVELDVRAGKRAEAIDVLMRAVADKPQAYELNVLLTDLLIDEGKLAQAAANIARLPEAAAPVAMIDYLRARIASQEGRWQEALTILQRAQTEPDGSTDWAGRLHALIGLCQRQVGDHERELAAFRKAVLQEPSWTPARFGLATALMANGLLDEAVGELQLIQKAPDAPKELWTVLASALIDQNLRRPSRQQNWNQVEQVLSRAEKMTPEALELPCLRAEVFTAQKKFEAAKKLLDQARARHPDQLIYWVSLADLAARQNQWFEATTLLEQAERNLGDSAELCLAKCRIWEREDSAAARQRLAALDQNLASLAPKARARVLRALAETWLRLGDRVRAETAWQRLAREQPDDPTSRFALFENALHENQLDKARMLLADLNTIEGAHGKLGPFASAAFLVHEAAGSQTKLDEARKILDQLGQRVKTWARVPLLLARIEELAGNYDKAVGHYLRAVEIGAREPRHLARLVQLLVAFKRYLSAQDILRNTEEQMTLPPDLVRLGAEVALANQNAQEAMRLAAQAVRPMTTDYRDCLWLGHIYHVCGMDPQAEEVLRQGVAISPETPDTWIALAEQLTRMSKREAAQTVVGEAGTKVTPRLAPYTRARCFEVMGLLDQAEEFYRHALADRHEDFIFLAAAVDFHCRADQPAQAQPYLDALLKLKDVVPAEVVMRARRQLALALSGQIKGDQARALALINENLAARPRQLADERACAFVLASNSSQRWQAIRVFGETAQHQPLDANEQLLLAQLYEADGDQPRAREQIVALLTAQPESPQFLSFYVRHLIQSEEFDLARDQLQKLCRLEPASRRTRELAKLLQDP